MVLRQDDHAEAGAARAAGERPDEVVRLEPRPLKAGDPVREEDVEEDPHLAHVARARRRAVRLVARPERAARGGLAGHVERDREEAGAAPDEDLIDEAPHDDLRDEHRLRVVDVALPVGRRAALDPFVDATGPAREVEDVERVGGARLGEHGSGRGRRHRISGAETA